MGDRGSRSRAPQRRGLLGSRYLGHFGGRSLLQHDQPPRIGDRYAAEPRISWTREVTAVRSAGRPARLLGAIAFLVVNAIAHAFAQSPAPHGMVVAQEGRGAQLGGAALRRGVDVARD